MKTPRIAILSHGYAPLIGGAERQTAALAPRLQRLGLDITVITRQQPGLARHEVIAGVPVWRLPVPGPKALASASFVVGACVALARLQPQLIHAQELFSTTSVALLARRLGRARVVATPHLAGPTGDLGRLLQKPLGRRRLDDLRAQVDHFVAISQALADELAQAGIAAERRTLIPNGVDTDEFAPLPPAARAARREALGLAPEAPVVVFCGRLVPQKRVNRLLEAWTVIQAEFPAARLLILGAGPDEAALRAQAGPEVRFEGAVDPVSRYLPAADIFVLPSAAEGLPVAMLEAMACGLTVIGTPVGGVPELIRPAETGYLVPVDDVPALIQTLRLALGAAATRARLGAQARALVQQTYSIETAAARLADLYRRLTAG